MKATIILMASIAAFVAYAEPTNGPPPQRHQTVESKRIPQLLQYVPLPAAQRPNEVKLGKVELSGILVEVVKKPNPFQLINPVAPPSYGSPEDNVMRDPISGHVSGLKLFSIRF